MKRTPTVEEIQLVREYECSMLGCSWTVISENFNGPVAIICDNCGDTKEVINGD